MAHGVDKISQLFFSFLNALVKETFGDVYKDPMADLMKLQQKALVTKYHEAF